MESQRDSAVQSQECVGMSGKGLFRVQVSLNPKVRLP